MRMMICLSLLQTESSFQQSHSHRGYRRKEMKEEIINTISNTGNLSPTQPQKT